MKVLLLIGDSVQMLYRNDVKRMLQGRMQVVSPEDNCRFSLYTLRYLFEWEQLCGDPMNVAAVHWNNGLWDVTRRTKDGEPLVSKDEYARNLERIIVELRSRFPNAKIIWATITPVNSLFDAIDNRDIDEYNEVALRIMNAYGIRINDLHSVIRAHPEYISDDDYIHETEEGSHALAQKVVETVLDEIGPID